MQFSYRVIPGDTNSLYEIDAEDTYFIILTAGGSSEHVADLVGPEMFAIFTAGLATISCATLFCEDTGKYIIGDPAQLLPVDAQ
jgi:hypothetical protein